MFVHSACCNAHWELVLNEDGSGDLVCEKCQKSISTDKIKIKHTLPMQCSCPDCTSEAKMRFDIMAPLKKGKIQ